MHFKEEVLFDDLWSIIYYNKIRYYLMYYVYILANSSNSTLYVGVTHNLIKRIWEHNSGINPASFTLKYKIFKLVYYESYTDIKSAIQREKQLKKWKRAWKRDIITKLNPNWADLSKIYK